MKTQTVIYSIFGECEAVVAKQMAVEHGLKILLDVESFASSARFNKHGQEAQFAIIMPRPLIRSFVERVALLRA